MISLSKGTGKKKGETNEEKDFGDFENVIPYYDFNDFKKQHWGMHDMKEL